MTAPTGSGAPELALKHRGITVELQIGNGHLYFNPFEEYSDRTPQNADVIVSLVSPGDVTGPREEHAFLSGFACYGTPQTVYFVGDQLDAYWKAERQRAPTVRYEVPGTGAGLHRLRTGGTATVGGHPVRIAPLTARSNRPGSSPAVGMQATVADRTFTYLQLAPEFLPTLAHERSDVLILVAHRWSECAAPLTELVRTHDANHFFLISAGAHKRERAAFLAALPPDRASPVVFKSGKWKVPRLADRA